MRIGDMDRVQSHLSFPLQSLSFSGSKCACRGASVGLALAMASVLHMLGVSGGMARSPPAFAKAKRKAAAAKAKTQAAVNAKARGKAIVRRASSIPLLCMNARELGSSAAARELGSSVAAQELGSSEGANELGSSAAAKELGSSVAAQELGSSAAAGADELGSSDSDADELGSSAAAAQGLGSSPLGSSAAAAEVPGNSPAAADVPGSSGVAAEVPGSSAAAAEGLGSSAAAPVTGSLTIPTNPSGRPGFVFCGKCRQEVPAFRAQLTGKSSGSWKCNGCNCRITQLNRAFGSWPPPEFCTLSSEAQASFYRSAHSLVDSKKVTNLAKATLEKIFTQRFIESSGGSYLPLSVYQQQGYDSGKIEKDCHDYLEHPVLGRVYRVAILSKLTENANETRNVQTLLAEGKRKLEKMKEAKKQLQEEKEKQQKKDDSSSSSSSSSISSSSSESSSDDDDGKDKKKKQRRRRRKRRRSLL